MKGVWKKQKNKPRKQFIPTISHYCVMCNKLNWTNGNVIQSNWSNAFYMNKPWLLHIYLGWILTFFVLALFPLPSRYRRFLYFLLNPVSQRAFKSKLDCIAAPTCHLGPDYVILGDTLNSLPGFWMLYLVKSNGFTSSN